MKAMRKLLAGVGLCVLGLVPAAAAELKLDVSLENPVQLAGKAQINYLKVSLKGFEWAREGQRAPLNVALVLDRSGSMKGEKLERAKEAARYAVDLLGAEDILSIVTYESEVQVLLPATKVRDKKAIRRLIDGIETDGSTALFAGVSKGASEVRKFLKKELVNRVLLLSDGLANVGPDSPGELAELGSSLRREGVSVTTIGLGLDFNEDLMVRLAQASDGNHAFVAEPRDLVKIFNAEFKDALSVVAREVVLSLRCAPGVKPLRILGREGEIRGQDITLNLNQVYSLQEKYFLIEVEVPALTAGKQQPVAEIKTSYLNLQTAQKGLLTASASVKGTASVQEQKQNRKGEVAEAVALQKNVSANDEAIRLRDSGNTAEAQKVLKDAAANLKALAEELQSPALQAESDAAAADAEKIDQEEEWNSQRKKMRANSYQTQNQQSY